MSTMASLNAAEKMRRAADGAEAQKALRLLSAVLILALAAISLELALGYPASRTSAGLGVCAKRSAIEDAYMAVLFH